MYWMTSSSFFLPTSSSFTLSNLIFKQHVDKPVFSNSMLASVFCDCLKFCWEFKCLSVAFVIEDDGERGGVTSLPIEDDGEKGGVTSLPVEDDGEKDVDEDEVDRDGEEEKHDGRHVAGGLKSKDTFINC